MNGIKEQAKDSEETQVQNVEEIETPPVIRNPPPRYEGFYKK